jgi:cyclic beta-1,2-glucan synthetase
VIQRKFLVSPVTPDSSEENGIDISDFSLPTLISDAARHENDAELLRSELFSIEQLKRHAVLMAGRHQIASNTGPDMLLPRLADNEKVLIATYDLITHAVASGLPLVSAEAWLFDNFYLIEQQITLARLHLPRAYSRQLPRLATGPMAGFPRIYDLALELISHMDGRIDQDNATHIIEAYQTVEPLQLGELWAFPIMLQLALLENLRRVGLRIASRRTERDIATSWADRMLATAEHEPKKLIQLLAMFADADVPLTAPFVEEFYVRLQAQGQAMAFVQTWIEQSLLAQGVTATQLSEAASRTAAANQISIANSIASLRFIGVMDWHEYVESLSMVDYILRQDPARIYQTQDFATRDRYRHAIEDLARECNASESAMAHRVIYLAQQATFVFDAKHRSAHVGYYLMAEGKSQLQQATFGRLPWTFQAREGLRRFRLPLYLGVIFLLSGPLLWGLLIMSGWFALHDWRFWGLAIIGSLAISSLVVALANLAVTIGLPPCALPRLDFSKGIPAEHRTMVIVPCLISELQEVDDLVEALEIRYLGNRDVNLSFALLTDLMDAPAATMPEDAAVISHARARIQRLNEAYDSEQPIFYLFHRPRVWNPYEEVWMGYERKRGKIEQFNALLRGMAPLAFSEIVGDQSHLTSFKYVITLDTDTQLPRDTAHALVGHMAHPLNRPVYDEKQGRIVQGYAILQPRTSASLVSAGKSWFTRLFAGESGIDPYTREVSDVYQDLFEEGSFIGKGIYDIDAFRQVLEGRFPENLILSHDLLESGYARSGLVTDVELIEEHPASYMVETSRRHRWIRGDWQLAGWLWPLVPGSLREHDGNVPRHINTLSSLSIWKIMDNLRRSLVAPAMLALLTAGWLLTPLPLWQWVLLIAGILILPPLLGAGIELIRKPEQHTWPAQLALTGNSVTKPLLLALLSMTLLPYDTLIILSAILYSGLRMMFTRRGLLLWQLPAYAIRNRRGSIRDFFEEMWVAPATAILMMGALWFKSPMDALLGMPILLLWLLSPLICWWISKPFPARARALSASQQRFLRLSSRHTWRYFADFVCAEEHWLPPDNFQEHPAPQVAKRTSPTNIGMSLLATQTAYDFGYVSAEEFLTRTANTLETMEKLERYRGHFYNWYDTRNLEILPPQYISAVDSGNLMGSLLILQAGLIELKSQPLLSSPTFQGLQDTLNALSEHLPPSLDPRTAEAVALLQEKLQTLSASALGPPSLLAADMALAEIFDLSLVLSASSHEPDSELAYWIGALDKQVRHVRLDLRSLVPDLPADTSIPTLAGLAEEKINPLGSSHPASIDKVSKYPAAVERLALIDELSLRCGELATMDFEFLYDTSSDLLSIGYDVSERRRDPACYDLLASEARLTSFLLIAEGQLPKKHWFSLGRLLTRQGGDLSLLSWSGSMFEYLMPQLMMPSYDNTLLDQSYLAAVSRQIEYGKQRGVPWGISESCYYATDMHQVYQYRAFGVPGLGFKRGLSDDLVIAPYASALALVVAPQAACLNLQAMANDGFLGSFGFYEAIDYTPSRVPPGKQYAVVRAFMAHHQGMSLLAYSHRLLDSPTQRRFMSIPTVKATALLLQERLPKHGSTLHPHAAEVTAAARPAVKDPGGTMRLFTDPNTPHPEVHLLSNGRYHVMATNAGGGYSRWRDMAVTRWREDATTDNWGTFIYLRDLDDGYYWSTSHQPTLRKAEHYEAIFVQARAEYRRRDQAIETHTEITVSPEDDVEIRRVTLTNQSSRTRRIEITSYAEVVLAPLNADIAHRAFSNLFVQTEILPNLQAILCTRRPRTPDEQVPWMFHLLAAPGAKTESPSYETDRASFIGRGRTAANPFAMAQDELTTSGQLSNTQGSVLDPIVAIRRTVILAPDESAAIQIVSGMADTREAALALLEKYCDRHFVERAFEMAWFQSQEVLRLINASESDARIYGRMAGSIIYCNASKRSAPSAIARNRLGQSGLWGFGVSGDLPIVIIRVSEIGRIGLVKEVLQAHTYWRMHGLVVDLVILNEDFSGYRAALHDAIIGLINAGPEAQIVDKPGGVFIRRIEDLSEEARVLFQAVARIVVIDSAETLSEQMERRVTGDRAPDRTLERLEPARERPYEPVYPLLSHQRLFDNGIGGFKPDGREYVITLDAGKNTPAPWVNVIASPSMGTVISESGSAYTWVDNAHEFRLTNWHNDPVSDSSGEALYIRDEETGAFWSPSPLPARGITGYVCRHGFGYTVFQHSEAGIASEVSHYVAMDAPVKIVVVKLRNHSGRPRRLSLTSYWELVLGEWRHANLMHISTEVDAYSGAILARNAFGRECANRVIFAHVSSTERSVTGNRTEFIGRNGSLAAPAAMRRKRLSGRTGIGLDPCAAIQSEILLIDGQEQEIVLVLGVSHNVDEARQLIERFGRPAGAEQALEAVTAYWAHTLGAIQVETPDIALNVLANGWLIYQTLSCRVWGRSGYYQSGGAYGFRDQLQDTMALVHTNPSLAREQLIRCAERQFPQGDVQHWWHPPSGKGVRTHFADDFLWLPYALCHYVRSTGDLEVLEERLHFLDGRELNPDEEAYYDQPQRSAEIASLYEHGLRAIKRGIARLGEHGLPLMGCGDWNDGMNLVGQGGKGESVWLAWFLYDNLGLFCELAKGQGDIESADLCLREAVQLLKNIEQHAWDGAWYRRAYFDDGATLGSIANEECQIDSISQSWSVISGGGEIERTRQAMAAVDQYLVQRDHRLIKLLTPPFDHSALEPGYIKGYVPGIRENGGQYTHAAIWTTMAFAMLGDNARAWELFSMTNPIRHGITAEQINTYKVEPYVMCADIYAAAPHAGRGGWTWYTGAAGWMYRLITETLLGLHREADRLCIRPRLSAEFDTYKIIYRYRDTYYHINVQQLCDDNDMPRVTVTLDGQPLSVQDEDSESWIALTDDRILHHVQVSVLANR